MEKLNIREILTYPFRLDGWFSRFFILFVLALVPILGWSVIAGYMLRVSKNWCDGNNKEYPSLSKILDLLGKGFIIIITLSIFLVPVYPAIMIPSAGIVIADVWGLLFIFISPYLVSKYAYSEHIEELFNFSAMIKFVQENTIHLVEAFFINIISLIVVVIPPFLLVYAGKMIIEIPKIGTIWHIIGWLSVCFGTVVALVGLIYFAYLFFSLAGNIHWISLHRTESDEVQKTVATRTA